MRYLLSLFLALPLLAQEPAKPEEKKAPETTEVKATEEKAAENPSPAKESWATGSVEVGYRWVSKVAGSMPVYRSIVDLGEGPKLFNVDLSIENASKKYFDRMNIFANNWGGDPYNTARLDITKEGWYRFTGDYRNIAYYNFLPSFANPGTGQGALLVSERAFDMKRRYSDMHLELFPSKHIIPYVAYERNWGRGSGITPFIAQNNEYPVPTSFDDRTWEIRAGIRFEMRRWHLTLEQGHSDFQDLQRIYETQNNPGNRGGVPLLGQQIFLSSLNQQYSVGGSGLFSRVLATASPFDWLNLYGQFLYSQPKITPNYTQINQGAFLLLSASRFFSGQQDTLTGVAKEPHTSGSFGFELFPRKRFRVMENVSTDRFHVSSSSLLAEQLLFGGNNPAVTSQVFAADRLIYNYNRQQFEVLFDLTKWLTLRAGHQFVWGNAEVPASPLSQIGPSEAGELRRHVGLAGLTVRPIQKLTVNLDYEGASGDRNYFRTSLQDYQRAKARARYQLMGSVLISANFSVLDNQNPAAGSNYYFRSRQNSLALQWAPAGGKRFSFLGEYTRYTMRSNISYLMPQDFSPAISRYRDDGHLATALVDIPLPGAGVVKPKLSFGGSMLASAGNRATRYYQPMGRFLLPLHKNVQWFGEWRYYGYTEFLYLYEGFRTHQFMTGLRLTL